MSWLHYGRSVIHQTHGPELRELSLIKSLDRLENACVAHRVIDCVSPAINSVIPPHRLRNLLPAV